MLKARYEDLKIGVIIVSGNSKGKVSFSNWWADILLLDDHVDNNFLICVVDSL